MLRDHSAPQKYFREGDDYPTTRYIAPCREHRESFSLLIPGETLPEDSESDDVPVRLLTSFAIYSKSRHLSPFDQVDVNEGVFYASGFVKPWIEDDDDSDDGMDDDDSSECSEPINQPLRVRLSQILEVNVHHIEDDFSDYNSATSGGIGLILNPYVMSILITVDNSRLYRRIYIRTQWAWYILEDPLDSYIQFYTPFWIKHRLFHELMSSAMLDPEWAFTLENFRAALPAAGVSAPTFDCQVRVEHLDCIDAVGHVRHLPTRN